MIVLEFFRDVFDGIFYWLYLAGCIFAFFYVLGIVGDNKREKINKKLKEKKTYDIESGREAAIAAMETKQVLAVDEDAMADAMAQATNAGLALGDMANGNNNVSDLKKEGQEEVPSVMVLNSSDQASQPATSEPAVVQPAVVQPAIQQPASAQPKAEEPLVLNSSTS